METLYRVQTPLIGISIVTILLVNLVRQRGWRQPDQRLFTGLLVTNFLLLALELSIDMVSGKTISGGSLLLTVLTMLFYLLNPVPGALYILYLKLLTGWNIRFTRLFVMSVFLPVIVNSVFAVVSLFTPFTFHVDAANVYHRGPWFYLMPAISALYLVVGPVFLMLNRHNVQKKEFSAFIFFPVPLLLGAVVQTLVYGVELLWIGLALSLLIAYLNVQSVEVSKDCLTGLFNRRRFDRELELAFDQERQLGGVMVDIDAFKKVNDTYGHVMGDHVLRLTADLLRSSVPRAAQVFRHGGDEFAILLAVENQDSLDEAVGTIKARLHQFNADKKLPFAVSLAIGSVMLDHAVHPTLEEFLKTLDQQMYRQKRTVQI